LKEHSIERDIISIIQCQRLIYFGHVTRMDKDRLPYILLYGYTQASRGKERAKKRWIDIIREDCMDIGIPIQEASHIVTDRDMWRNTVGKWAARARGHRRRRHGYKSNKSSQYQLAPV